MSVWHKILEFLQLSIIALNMMGLGQAGIKLGQGCLAEAFVSGPIRAFRRNAPPAIGPKHELDAPLRLGVMQ